jgi:uncharacterized protein (TIGR02246 family)
MVRTLRLPIAVLGIVAIAGCMERDPSASDTGVRTVTSVGPADAAADEQAIRAINPAWFTAMQAGDADAVVAFYSDDAVVSAPGAAPARGTAAIRELFANEIAGLKAAGLSQSSGANPEFAVSGDLGYEWNTYTVKDSSGKTVDTGKYLSVFGRRNGKWVIVRDIWNSDMPATPAS